MKTLNNLIKQLAELATRMARLEQFRTQAQKEVDQVLQIGDLEDEKQLRKLSDARMRVDLYPVRQKQLAKEIAAKLAEFKPEYRAASNQWARFVTGKATAKFDEFIAAVLPFFEGDERAARRHFRDFDLPVIYEIRRAIAGEEVSHDQTPEHYLHQAERFVARVEKYCKQFGWPLPE